eukprot:scaffold221783_cov20-Prasinocladus_malaysianus.AAC.1
MGEWTDCQLAGGAGALPVKYSLFKEGLLAWPKGSCTSTGCTHLDPSKSRIVDALITSWAPGTGLLSG